MDNMIIIAWNCYYILIHCSIRLEYVCNRWLRCYGDLQKVSSTKVEIYLFLRCRQLTQNTSAVTEIAKQNPGNR